jgi:peroxiredoxin
MANHLAKLESGSRLQPFTLPLVGGGRVTLGGEGRWQLIVVYRGKHCPLCKIYLKRLQELLPQAQEINLEVVALSADPKEKAEADAAEMGVTMPIAYDLSLAQMTALGLYISHPRSPKEHDRPFPEPAVFAVRPDGRLQIVEISNAPFVRPDLTDLIAGLKYIQSIDYPIRGTLV